MEYLAHQSIVTKRQRNDVVGMDASARAMVEAIHASPTQAVLYFAGGASQVL